MRADRDLKPCLDTLDGLQIRGSKLKAFHLLDTECQQVGINDPNRASGRFELESLVKAALSRPVRAAHDPEDRGLSA
jgi:hypothetical protein